MSASATQGGHNEETQKRRGPKLTAVITNTTCVRQDTTHDIATAGNYNSQIRSHQIYLRTRGTIGKSIRNEMRRKTAYLARRT